MEEKEIYPKKRSIGIHEWPEKKDRFKINSRRNIFLALLVGGSIIPFNYFWLDRDKTSEVSGTIEEVKISRPSGESFSYSILEEVPDKEDIETRNSEYIGTLEKELDRNTRENNEINGYRSHSEDIEMFDVSRLREEETSRQRLEEVARYGGVRLTIEERPSRIGDQSAEKEKRGVIGTFINGLNSYETGRSVRPTRLIDRNERNITRQNGLDIYEGNIDDYFPDLRDIARSPTGRPPS